MNIHIVLVLFLWRILINHQVVICASLYGWRYQGQWKLSHLSNVKALMAELDQKPILCTTGQVLLKITAWFFLYNLYSVCGMCVCVSCSVVSDSLRPHGLYSSSGSSVHGILRARILEWVAIPFSRGYSWPRDQSQVSCMAGRFFTIWTTRKALVRRETHDQT